MVSLENIVFTSRSLLHMFLRVCRAKLSTEPHTPAAQGRVGGGGGGGGGA